MPNSPGVNARDVPRLRSARGHEPAASCTVSPTARNRSGYINYDRLAHLGHNLTPAESHGLRGSAMSANHDTDTNALMARLADGDRAAFTPIFRQLWPSVLRFCMSLLRNEADAADAAQQAMEKIFVRAADYDPRRAAMPWALAIASWECRTIMRKRTRRREAPEDAAANAIGGDDLEEELAQRELTMAAVGTLGQLSEADRETLLSTFWEEAASAGGPTLRKRRERALTRLRVAWKRLYGLE